MTSWRLVTGVLAFVVLSTIGVALAQQPSPDAAAKCPAECQILIARQRDRIDQLSKTVTTLQSDLKTLQAQVTTISGSIPTRIVLGPEHVLDYRKMNNGESFDHTCPDGSVAVGWGYGHLHDDARFFCRPISIGK